MNDDKAADNHEDTGPLIPGGGRRRDPPTIDLSKSDVTDVTPPEPVASEPSQASSWRARLNDVTSRFARAKSESPKSEPPDAASAPPIVDDMTPQRRIGMGTTIAISAVSGALAALMIGGGWLAMHSSDQSADARAIASLNNRVTQAESKIAAPRDDSALTRRLDALDATAAGLRKDVAALRADLDSTKSSIASLQSAGSADKPAADVQASVSSLEGRLSKLEQATPSAPPQAIVQAPPPSAPDDSALRLALVATALDQAVNQGSSFASELATATRLSGDAAVLKSLAPFAGTGVPGAQALCRDLLTRLPQAEKAPEPVPANATWFERLRASAAHLVRVTRVDADGTDRTNLLARARSAAQRDDLAEAKRAVAALPDKDRTTLQGWIDKVDARDAALAASRQFVQDATTALPKPASGDSR